MKKLFLSFATVGIMFFMSSCSSSNSIDKFMDAVESENYEEATKILESIDSSTEDLNKIFEEMSLEEAKEFATAAQKYSDNVKTAESKSLVMAGAFNYMKKAKEAGNDKDSSGNNDDKK